MPTEQSKQFCPCCREDTLVARPSPNHLVHGVITLFLVGFWLPVWLVACQRGPWRCQRCGTEVGGESPPMGFLKILVGIIGLIIWIGILVILAGGVPH